MAYTIVSPQPPLRDTELEWADIGPGLYADGEVLVEIDGHYTAVSVKTDWLENGSGVAFTATARWCEDNGQTKLCPNGCHVESIFSYTADPTTVSQFGVAPLAKDVLLIALGEDPLLQREYTNEDGSTGTTVVIDLHPTLKLNASIRQQITNVSEVSTVSDAASLLL